MGAAKIKKKNGNYPTPTEKAANNVITIPTLPHYTAEIVVALFSNNDSQIAMNDYGTAKSIQLSDEPGYFKYSDESGGTATFYITTNKTVGASRAAATNTPLFTAPITITDGMRKAKCSAENCNCKSKWFDLIHNCNCSQHHDGEFYDVIPRIEVCSTEECDGQHGHLLGICYECFNSDLIEGKAPENITADNISLQLR
jgi:hypothetical protein